MRRGQIIKNRACAGSETAAGVRKKQRDRGVIGQSVKGRGANVESKTRTTRGDFMMRSKKKNKTSGWVGWKEK